MSVGGSRCFNDIQLLLWAVGEARCLRQREGVAAATPKDLHFNPPGRRTDAESGRVGPAVARSSEFFTEWQQAAR